MLDLPLNRSMRAVEAETSLNDALHTLERFANDLAAGRPTSDIAPALAQLKSLSGQGAGLLRVLDETAKHCDSDASRRRFFHAARAFISLQPGEDHGHRFLR